MAKGLNTYAALRTWYVEEFNHKLAEQLKAAGIALPPLFDHVAAMQAEANFSAMNREQLARWIGRLMKEAN
jgi:hypothetical protein